MVIRISSILHDRLLAMAAKSPDVEVCGLLFGDSEICAIAQTPNVARDPRRAFEISPQDLFAAIRAERSGGEKLCGYFHSHPVGPPIPSATDATQATADGRMWIIIGDNQVAAWTMTVCGIFDDVLLEIVE